MNLTVRTVTCPILAGLLGEASHAKLAEAGELSRRMVPHPDIVVDPDEIRFRLGKRLVTVPSEVLKTRIKRTVAAFCDGAVNIGDPLPRLV